MSVFCGDLELHPGTRFLFTSPTLLFEVTSAGTREVDETTKLDEYRSIPSLAAYVLVDQDDHRVTIHRRDGNKWAVTEQSTGKVELPGVPATLDIDELYASLRGRSTE